MRYGAESFDHRRQGVQAFLFVVEQVQVLGALGREQFSGPAPEAAARARNEDVASLEASAHCWLPSNVWSVGGPASVDSQDRAGHIRRGVRGQVDGGSGDLGQLPPAAQGNLLADHPDAVLAVLMRHVHLGQEGSGRDGVYVHAPRRPLHG